MTPKQIYHIERAFEPITSKFGKNAEVGIIPARECIKAVLPPLQSNSFFHLAEHDDSADARRLLSSYYSSILDSISPNYLIIVKKLPGATICWPVPRPELLETYIRKDKIYLAISERQFLTAVNGNVELVELADFSSLTKAPRPTSFKSTCKNWGISGHKAEDIIEREFREKTHLQQVDFFQEEKINYLLYEDDVFLDALPLFDPQGPSFCIRKEKRT